MSDPTKPAGGYWTYSPAGLEDMHDEISLDAPFDFANQYSGTFHLYFRGREYDAANDPGNIGVQFKIVAGSGGLEYFTSTQFFTTINDWYLMDFGRVEINMPSLLTGDEVGDSVQFVLRCSAKSNETDLYAYDLILIPVDEWTGDFINVARTNLSAFDRGKLLELDSALEPRRQMRAPVKDANNNDRVMAQFSTDSTGPVILCPNVGQSLWTLSANYYVSYGVHDGGNNLTYFEDASGDFLREGVQVGQPITNETDGTAGIITAVSATRIDGELFGTGDKDWDDNDIAHILTNNCVSYPEVSHSVQTLRQSRYLAARGSN